MDFKDLQGKPAPELQKLLAQHREKLRDLNFKVANKEVKNNQEARQVKKVIARILLLLKQQQLSKTK